MTRIIHFARANGLVLYTMHNAAFTRVLSRCIPLLFLAACATVRDGGETLPDEFALPPAGAGVLADMASEVEARGNTGESGFMLLEANDEALRWRLALIDSAVSSLDILYYLWYGDDVGRLVLKRVLDAADRGVKVRLLVDDLVLVGKDKALVAIDKYPNISLRLFNPKRQRKLGMVADGVVRYKQMNIRMHNKLVVADNHAAIIGGRNIANAYFGLDEKYNFIDVDVMGFGAVAQQSSELFDNFWNGPWSAPASQITVQVDEEDIPGMVERMVAQLGDSAALENFPREPSNPNADLEKIAGSLHYGTSQMLYDRFDDGMLVRGMTDPLGRIINSAEQQVDVANAYIIPDQDFVDGAKALADRGITVRILTNSLASHDVPAVNSHYKKWRRPLVESGAKLYEQQAIPADRQTIDTPPVVSKSVGLHSKAFVVDARHVFIGSMNFDPRSANINSEMGVVIDSPGLARELTTVFEAGIAPQNAWRVTLDAEEEITWTSAAETVTRQPALGCGQRIQDVFFMLFPASQF